MVGLRILLPLCERRITATSGRLPCRLLPAGQSTGSNRQECLRYPCTLLRRRRHPSREVNDTSDGERSLFASVCDASSTPGLEASFVQAFTLLTRHHSSAVGHWVILRAELDTLRGRWDPALVLSLTRLNVNPVKPRLLSPTCWIRQRRGFAADVNRSRAKPRDSQGGGGYLCF